MTNKRYNIIPKTDGDLVNLLSFGQANNYMIFFTIQHYLEFKFIYSTIIVDTFHKTMQQDACEVTGGWGTETLTVNEFIEANSLKYS